MRRLITAICALAMVVPAGLPAAAHESGHQQQLDRVEARLAKQRSLLRETNRERKGLLGDIASADARRDDLAAKVEELAGDLEKSEQRLAQAQASVDIARRSLFRWNHRLDQTRQRLASQRKTLGGRAAAAYKMGAAGLVDVMLGASNIRMLTDRVEFVRSVLSSDSYLLSSIRVNRSQFAEERDRVAGYRSILAEHRNAIAEEVQRIRALKAEQEALQSEVEATLAEREALLEDVETTKAAYEKAVAQLEAESARIRSFLQGGASRGGGNPNARFYWPTAGSIGSGYGWRTHPIFGTRRFHAGVDIGLSGSADCGNPIWAAEDGVVVSAGWQGGYGQATVIDHGDGLASLYAHQSSIGVSVGQRVSRAQVIGAVGTTGWSTGCHLHFEARVNGNPVDPVPYLT